MPEGPEVRRSADRIARALEGERIHEVRFGQEALAPWNDALSGRRLESVATHGKATLLRFGGGFTVYSHNQLYGRWQIARRGRLPETARQLRLALHGSDRSALLYSASDIAVLKDGEVDGFPRLARLGPDPLHATTTARTVRDRALSMPFARRRLGGLLLDQSFAAGLGNYLRSEILWVARLHPALRPSDLDDTALTGLAKAVVSLPRRSYRTGGVTNSRSAAAAGRAAGLPRRRWRHFVFGREDAPCPACGGPVRRLIVAGRRLYLCPDCQPEDPS
ncbi:MAG: endonuclease VIII [Gammaproteobacteria bacterium]